MGFERFTLLLGLRLTCLLLTSAVTVWLLMAQDYPTAALITLVVAVLQILELSRYVSRTNQELARFLDAVRYADFGQRFTFSGSGAGFAELGETFTDILDRFRADRSTHERELRHLKALVEHVPVPLISLHADTRIDVWNNAARRLFGERPIQRLDDLARFGPTLVEEVRSIAPGERKLVRTEFDQLPQSLTISASEIVTRGSREKLISLQNIQTELDGMQLTAWQDLVRVLTHEIMNSITPVSSLAKTASDLVTDVSERIADQPQLVETLVDVKKAVDTLARRSDGLTEFVSSYQQLMGLPDPERSRFRVADLFTDVTGIATVGWAEQNLELDRQIEPVTLELDADRHLLEQLLINLLKNAEQALTGAEDGRVSLRARLNNRGRVSIEVTDNGPGISNEVAARIFVPFYTTRREGSGVGLALSRQIMNAHGGTISFSTPREGGSRFTLAF